jgi:hypothetical protein
MWILSLVLWILNVTNLTRGYDYDDYDPGEEDTKVSKTKQLAAAFGCVMLYGTDKNWPDEALSR